MKAALDAYTWLRSGTVNQPSSSWFQKLLEPTGRFYSKTWAEFQMSCLSLTEGSGRTSGFL